MSPSRLGDVELKAILKFTSELARRAGAIMKEGSAAIRGQAVSEKKNAGERYASRHRSRMLRCHS